MSEYMKFKDSQPEVGRLVELKIASNGFSSYDLLEWVKGRPLWSGQKAVHPDHLWRYSEISEPVSPKTQAQPPADTEKIKFRVEDGMLVGENTDAEWCVATPVSEAYDVLIANASRFDTDPNSLEERNKRQQEVIEVQVEELTKYRAALKAKEEER